MVNKLKYDCITLIGMPGVGKSTFGKLLASKFNYVFLDIDKLIQASIHQSIRDYIKEHGEVSFQSLEESFIESLVFPDYGIISTGGSVIYSPVSMKRLSEKSHIVFLNDTVENIKKRVSDPDKRGVVMKSSQTIEGLYEERFPLYKKYSQTTIDIPHPFSLFGGINFLSDSLT